MAKKRVVMIVLDSVGVGAAPDAAEFGDEGANTLLHLYQQEGLRLKNLEKRGLLQIIRETASREERTALPEPTTEVPAAYGRALEKSRGKDTTTGHWEMAGLITETPFPTYPQGFPEEVLAPFRAATGRGVLGNKPASGTAIIEEYGRAHLQSGDLIVYTSADSVFQLAAHEAVVPPEQLYEYCRIARRLLTGAHAVGRVIARPFEGKPGAFRRTVRRHDFSLVPPSDTMLDLLQTAGLPVVAVGKIKDIFAGKGITRALATTSNEDGVEKTLQALQETSQGLIFTNLVEFDMIYGHRNDGPGYAAALQAFDDRLPDIEAALTDEDLLILTADHGCDPHFPGTDHTRESVPVLCWSPRMRRAVSLGVRTTFADIAETVCEWFSVVGPGSGRSFAPELRAAES